jgi:NLR family CARD domain-containing protein 3
MLRKFDKLIDSVGLLDLFDYPFKSDDLILLESDYSRKLLSTLQNSCDTSKQVSALRFGHTLIDETGAGHIASALQSPHCTLHKIQFVNNEIGPDGAMIIAEGLKMNTTLTTLEIIDDDIAAFGARALAEVLQQNQVLSSLTLQNNSITCGSGIDCISDALRMNTTLRVLE